MEPSAERRLRGVGPQVGQSEKALLHVLKGRAPIVGRLRVGAKTLAVVAAGEDQTSRKQSRHDAKRRSRYILIRSLLKNQSKLEKEAGPARAPWILPPRIGGRGCHVWIRSTHTPRKECTLFGI